MSFGLVELSVSVGAPRQAMKLDEPLASFVCQKKEKGSRLEADSCSKFLTYQREFGGIGTLLVTSSSKTSNES